MSGSEHVHTDPPHTHPLATYLANRDVPCPSCGYNLRNLAASNCPECGEPLELRLTPPNALNARYLACVLAMGGAWSVMTTILALVTPAAVQGWTGSWNTGERFLFSYYPAFITLASSVGLALLLPRRGQRWFRCGPGAARTMLTTLCVTTSVGSVIAWCVWFYRVMS